jgi:transcriptional regulator with GAF, ATPase, and Fis domain/predicted ATPase/predicted Ser/Thr protein kinase
MPADFDHPINQRYFVVRPLGQGGMGSVYLVGDTHQGDKPVALKILRPDGIDAASVELFKEEFRSMTRLRHPNLAEVYDFGTVEGDGRYFLTMEYVEGKDLGSLPRSSLAGSFENLAVQCLRALDYIHSRGLLHNDIKPQNIMIRPPFQVKILDFGLAHRQAATIRPGLSGTIHYIAPERFGPGLPDQRSDLYSLGVVLYQVLTGSLPYDDEDAGKIVTAIMGGRLRPPRDLDPEIQPRFESFVLALLARDPAARPASSSAALELLNAGSAEPQTLDTPETYASFVTSGKFVGRDAELASLIDLAADHVRHPGADDGRPRLVLVSGASGIGKSRLLREMKHRLQLAGIRNLTGRCYEDGGVPFQPFVEVLRQLPHEREVPARARAVLDQLLAEKSGAEGAQLSAPRTPGGKTDKGEFLSGLAEAFETLAAETPGIVFLEDLHWSDAPGVDLLEHLIQRPARGQWLFVGSLRDEEARTAPIGSFVQRFGSAPRVRRVPLDPLDPEEVTDLLASMVPFEDRPAKLARLLAERTDGNPLYVEELMRSLAEEGTVRRRGGAWIAESRTFEAIRLPPSLASAVLHRLSGLAPGERSLAETLSVFNRPVTAALLSRALGLDQAAIAEPVAMLERLRLVVIETPRTGAPLIDLAHSRIRRAIYEELPDERRRALHLAVGSAIEAANRDAIESVVEELAHHFAAADDRERAVTYLLRAAEKADALFNPLRQVELLQRALDLLPAEDSARRLYALGEMALSTAQDLSDYETGLRHARLLQEEARKAGDLAQEAKALRVQSWALSFLEDHRGALDVAQRALAIARGVGDTLETAWCLSYLGTMLARQGHHTEAIVHLEEARGLCESLGHTATLLGVMGSQSLCNLGLGRFAVAREIMERLLSIAKEKGFTYHYHRNLPNFGIILQETGDLVGGIRAMEEALAWARERANLGIFGHALNSLGGLYAHRGLFDKATHAMEEERANRQEANDIASQIQILDFLGQIDRELGRLEQAEKRHREGLEIARRLNVRMQQGYLLASLAADRLARGDTKSAEDSAREAQAIGREIGHVRITSYALSVLALAAAARRDKKAVAGATRSLTRLDARGLRYYDRLQLNLVLGRCALAIGKPADAEREARAGLAAAEKGGFREFQWRFHALLGSAREERGLSAEATASYNAAFAIIKEVATDIEDAAMRDDYEKEPGRQEIIQRASEVSPSPVQAGAFAGATKRTPVKMLTTIYEITQIINSILDLKELLNKVMDLAIDIVEAERGLIFLYRSETDEMEMVVARNMERQTIKDATEYSRSILKEAGRGLPVLSHDAVTDARFKEFRSVSMYNIRSLLCVPLRIKNRILGTVYVDTRKPGVVFSQEDLHFLEAFANQAAVAIENARLYDQVRQENRYLKQAVQERYGYENIVGRSPKMRDVFATLGRVTTSNLPVLIRGESGTGKELVARAIHHNSARRDRRFFSENCAALPDTLLESELFGHAKGAFTGADTSRRGLFELADGGTLFLDEVGDMSLIMQSKLLRVLQDGEMRPVGSEASRHVDVRIISATSRDLEAMIKAKTFRQDLYFRLNVITVKLPALRDRKDDIPLLVDHSLGKIAQENRTPKLRVDGALMAMLTRYDWPGNVRELENQIYKLALFASGDTLTLADAEHDEEFRSKVAAPGTRGVDSRVTRDDLTRALAETKGNRDEAARRLGISRATLFRKLKQFDIAQKHAAPRPARRTHPA